jgi:hypothetical protein
MNRNLKFIVFAEDCARIARCLDVEVSVTKIASHSVGNSKN